MPFYELSNRILSKRTTSQVVLLTILTVLNFITHEKTLGCLISIPEIVIVLYYSLKNRIEEAYLLHTIFSLTCIAIPFSSLTAQGGGEYVLYNYSKLKLIGPLGFSQVISLLILLKLYSVKPVLKKGSLFVFLGKTLLFMAILATITGCIGLFFSDYHFRSFVIYVVYIYSILLNIMILKRLYSEKFLINLRRIMMVILISAPFASLICYSFDFIAQYGSSNIVIQSEVSYYTPILLFSLLSDKKRILPLLAVLASFFVFLSGGAGGKGIIIFMFVIICFLYKLYFSSYTILSRRYKLFMRSFVTILILFLVVRLINVYKSLDYSLFLYKLDSVFSLFSIFQSPDAIALLPNSPRIRMASLMNIFEEFSHNPYFFLFGKGYGGYFEDINGLITASDLSSAFSVDQIYLGKFSRPHDTIASVPLVNGFLGLALILYIVFKYVKKIKLDYFAFAAIPWLFLTFYYNFQFAFVGLLMLYLTEKNEICFIRRSHISTGTRKL